MTAVRQTSTTPRMAADILAKAAAPIRQTTTLTKLMREEYLNKQTQISQLTYNVHQLGKELSCSPIGRNFKSGIFKEGRLSLRLMVID